MRRSRPLVLRQAWPYGVAMDALALIAEDDLQIADILDRYFVREGFRTMRAGDGATALELHAALKPDVVLLDVMMPRIDGWAVLSEILHRGDTPVIMMTALDQDLDKLQALRMGRTIMSSNRSIRSNWSPAPRPS